MGQTLLVVCCIDALHPTIYDSWKLTKNNHMLLNVSDRFCINYSEATNFAKSVDFGI